MLTKYPGATTGRRGSDLVRFAVDPSVESKQVWLESPNPCRRIYDLSDMLIEVNSRQVVFYRRVFGFRVIAPLRECSRVGAPYVLMRLRREVLEMALPVARSARRRQALAGAVMPEPVAAAACNLRP